MFAKILTISNIYDAMTTDRLYRKGEGEPNTKMDNTLVISAIFAHFLSDFVFQTNKLAMLKSKNAKGVALHCMVTGIIHFIILCSFGLKGILLSLILLALHFLVDLMKLKLGNIPIPTTYFFIDQALHLSITIALASKVKASSLWITLAIAAYFKLIILLIVCTYVATIVIKQLYFSFGILNLKETTFFETKERGLDLLFTAVLLSLLYLKPSFYIADILCIAGVYYYLHTKLVRYVTKWLNIKLLFYIAWVIGCYVIYLLI